jgi:putative tricarboxylic transport membrane protein
VTDQPHQPPSSPDPPAGRVKAPQDLVAGLSLIAISLFALWATSSLGGGRIGSPGPGMLPRGVAVLVGLVGVLLVVASFLHRGERLERWGLRGPLFICLSVIGFALTVRTPGLAVAGPLVVLVGGAASPEARFKELLLFGLVLTALCIGLFRFALHLPMPILVIPGLVTL